MRELYLRFIAKSNTSNPEVKSAQKQSRQAMNSCQCSIVPKCPPMPEDDLLLPKLNVEGSNPFARSI